MTAAHIAAINSFFMLVPPLVQNLVHHEVALRVECYFRSLQLADVVTAIVVVLPEQ